MSSDLLKRLESELAKSWENQRWFVERAENGLRQVDDGMKMRKRKFAATRDTSDQSSRMRRRAAMLENRAATTTAGPTMVTPTPTQTSIVLDTDVPLSVTQSVAFTLTGFIPGVGTDTPSATAAVSASIRTETAASSTQAASAGSTMPTTALIGIIAGSVVGAITIITLISCFAIRWRRRQQPAIISNCIERKESYASFDSAGSGQSSVSNPFADPHTGGGSARSTRPTTINTTTSKYNKAYLPPVPEEGSPALHSPLRPPPLRISPHAAQSRGVDAPLETALLPSPSQNPFNSMRIPFLSSNRASVQSSIFSSYSESDAASIATSRRESNIHPAYRKWRDSLWSVGASSRHESRIQSTMPMGVQHNRTPSSENLLASNGTAAAGPSTTKKPSHVPQLSGRLSSIGAYAKSDRDARTGMLVRDKSDASKGDRERKRSSATVFKAHPGNLVVL